MCFPAFLSSFQHIFFRSCAISFYNTLVLAIFQPFHNLSCFSLPLFKVFSASFFSPFLNFFLRFLILPQALCLSSAIDHFRPFLYLFTFMSGVSHFFPCIIYCSAQILASFAAVPYIYASILYCSDFSILFSPSFFILSFFAYALFHKILILTIFKPLLKLIRFVCPSMLSWAFLIALLSP